MRGYWFVNEGGSGIATVKYINGLTLQVQSLCYDETSNGGAERYLAHVLCDAGPGDLISMNGRTVAHKQAQPLEVQ